MLLDEDGTLALATLAADELTVLAQAEVARATSWTVPTLVGNTLYLRDRVNIMALDLGANGRRSPFFVLRATFTRSPFSAP